MADFVCHGDILYSETTEKLKIFEDSYLVVQDGFIEGIYESIPEKFQGMDKLLFDWLNDYTFPQEARFASMDYAKNVYDQVVTELLRQGTFHASLFTTIHYDASDYLFHALSDKGMYAYVGKVNMDMNSPEYLCETTEESLKQTERFLAEHQGADGSVFDRVGSLEKGYRFNALVLDGLEDNGFTLTPEERAERFCYSGDDRNIVGRFIDGEEITI